MKKLLCAILTLVLTLVPLLGASAEETGVITTANGVVESVNTHDITAPYSGVLKPFLWKTGDAASASDLLFEMETVKVCAPADGVLQAVFAEPGELCEDAIALYGMIACMERDVPFIVDANTSGAYNDDANRTLHMGETLYIEETNNKNNEGRGRVTAVRGTAYTVELIAGDFELDDNVKMYRDLNKGAKNCVGSGRIKRAADIPILGSGRVLRVYHTRGDRVVKGEPLLELVSGDADAENAVSALYAGCDGAVAVKVAPGQQVYKGQVLATVYDLSQMRVVAAVDEMDLGLIKVGGDVSIVFDRYENVRVAGVIQKISRIGSQKLNATYYDIEISYTTSAETLPGMNATVWLDGN